MERRIGTEAVESTGPRTRIGRIGMGGKERRNVIETGKSVIVKVRGIEKGKGRESGQGEAGADRKENQTRVVTWSSEKEKRRENQGNETEESDLLEQSSDGLSGNWARHWISGHGF